jgi:hypothetical protein
MFSRNSAAKAKFLVVLYAGYDCTEQLFNKKQIKEPQTYVRCQSRICPSDFTAQARSFTLQSQDQLSDAVHSLSIFIAAASFTCPPAPADTVGISQETRDSLADR